MRTLIATILTALMVNTTAMACVTIDRATGTYTVDKSGCVEKNDE